MHRALRSVALVVFAATVLFSIACTPTASPEPPPPPERVHVTPAPMQALSDDVGFSQAVRVGTTVWVSGQVGYGPDGIPSDPAEQARIAFQNLDAVLEEAGASLADIVELTTFHASMADMPGFMPVKAEFIRAPFPAWSAVEVRALADPGLVVEIKAVAVIGSGTIP